jgi:hypothetical protein
MSALVAEERRQSARERYELEPDARGGVLADGGGRR